jgi:hypothetical protein
MNKLLEDTKVVGVLYVSQKSGRLVYSRATKVISLVPPS